MPLFVCDFCFAIENTATTEPEGYWCRDGGPARCSECLTGSWHGRFEKRLATREEVTRRRSEFMRSAGREAVLARGADQEGRS